MHPCTYKYLRLLSSDKLKVISTQLIEIIDSFSAHADRLEMLDFIKIQKGRVKKIFLVHGEIDRQEKFREFLGEKGFKDVEIPELGEEFKL